MMSHLVQAIVGFAKAHTLLAYGLAFLLTGAEAFPVVGALVPGTATIVAFGALVPSGALGFWQLLIATTTGAIAGDGLSFWLGHHYKGEAAARWPLRRYPHLFERGDAFFKKHGGKAILIARFTPGVRAVVPVVAGMLGMTVARFYGVNILSAVIWAPAHVVTGVLIGASLTFLGAMAGRLAALVAIVFGAVGIVVWLTPRATQWLTVMTARGRGPLLTWASARDTWFRHQVLSILDPRRTELRGLAVLGALLIGSLWLLIGVLEDLIAGDPLVRADEAVLHLLQSLRVDWADQLATAMSELGDGTVTLVVAGVALLWLDWRHAWRAMAYGIAAVIGAILFSAGVDLAIQRPQPIYIRAGWSLFPFPGGRIAVATALFGFLTVLIGCEVGVRLRLSIATAATAFVAILAFSRLYLGAEWFSTAAAGVTFGLTWAALLSIAYLVRRPDSVRPVSLCVIAGLTLALAGGANIALTHHSDMLRYAIEIKPRAMTLSEWRQDEWASLPVRRLDLLGEFEQPFTIQWLGDLGALKSDLLAQGWTPPVTWTLRSTFGWLSPHVDLAALPVLRRLNSGRAEGLVMIKTGAPLSADERLVLRLWRSDVVVSTPGVGMASLWIGTVAEERAESVLSLLTVVEERWDMNAPLHLLAPAIQSTRTIRRPDYIPDAFWDGTVLLGTSPNIKAAS